jgi:hypothetical protein
VKIEKPEYLNPKFETMSKFQFSKLKTSQVREEAVVLLFWSLVFWIFEFVSSFDIRISDLSDRKEI